MHQIRQPPCTLNPFPLNKDARGRAQGRNQQRDARKKKKKTKTRMRRRRRADGKSPAQPRPWVEVAPWCRRSKEVEATFAPYPTWHRIRPPLQV